MNFKSLYKKYNGVYMESSCYDTPEFLAFVSAFKRGLKAAAKKEGFTVTAFSKGHFEVSGFIRRDDGRCLYFRVGDMRFSDAVNTVLYRFVKDEKDYRGEFNRYAPLDRLVEAMLSA